MITVIYAHPNPKSLNKEIARRVEKVLKETGEKHIIVDLYADGFNPVMQQADLQPSLESNKDPLVQRYQGQVAESNKLIFIYPTWWSAMPAILKGYFDKVFAARFAFKYIKVPFFNFGRPVGLLKGKRALVITTIGAPVILEKIFLDNRTVKIICKDILAFCGIKPSYIQISKAVPGNENHIARQLEKMEKRVHKFIVK